jgi:deoxycytidine triphosphate deaminase
VSVLCDRQIKHLCDGIHYDGPPMIDPFREENVQPASIDLLMSTEFRVFKNDNTPYIDLVARRSAVSSRRSSSISMSQRTRCSSDAGAI